MNIKAESWKQGRIANAGRQLRRENSTAPGSANVGKGEEMVIEDYDGLEGLDVLNHVNEKLAKDLPGLAGLADWWLLELAMSSDNSEDVKALRNPEAVKILRRRILRRQLEWGVLGDRWLEHHRETAREVAREMLADGTPLVPALRLRLEKAVAEP